MLVLTRKVDETIVLPGAEVTIRVLSIAGGKVKLGIDAPDETLVLRGEIHERGDHERRGEAPY